MAKYNWTLRKLNLGTEEVQHLSKTPLTITHSKFWIAVWLALFPIFLTVTVQDRLSETPEISMYAMIPILLITGLLFIQGFQKLFKNKAVLQLTTDYIEIKQQKYHWFDIEDINVKSTYGTPDLIVNLKNGNTFKLGLGYLDKLPKQIHTMICKYYSCDEKSDI